MTEAATPPNLHGLVELGNREGVDVRPTLLRVMTDLYIQKPSHTEQEEKHFTELALRLIELVDAKTRAIVADKIAGYPPAPAKVRQRLLRDLIVIKEPEAPEAAVFEPEDHGRAGRRAQRIVLRRRYRRAPADPAQSRLCPAAAGGTDRARRCQGGRATAWRPRRSGTTPRSSLAGARARARRFRGHRRGGSTRTSPASRSWSRRWRSTCHPSCCSGCCYACTRRSASRCSASMSWRCSTRRSSPKPRSA